jgi:hypothetical protein
MKKNFLAACVAAVSFMCGGFVMTSCSEQTAIPVEARVVTEYLPNDVERIIDNTVVWNGKDILFNGATALTARVAPDSLTLTMPANLHKEAVITDFLGDNRWKDSNGNGFSGSLQKYEKEGLTLAAALSPADPFSKLTPIHPKVSMVEGDFRLQGYAELTESGKRETFDLHVENGRYFLCDTSVTVRTITDTQYEIQYRDTTEYIYVGKDAIVINGYGYGSIDFTVGNKSFSFRLDLDSLNILRDAAGWGVATKVSEDANGFSLNDAQKGRYTKKENGINLESVSFVGTGASFTKLNDSFKYGTTSVKVVVSYTNEKNEKVTREFSVSGSYFHELTTTAKTEDVTPPVVVDTNHTYTVDSIRSDVKDSDGNLIGEKMRITVMRDDSVTWKVQYMTWETGLLSGTLTGTQVGDNVMLRPTQMTSDVYTKDDWEGTDRTRKGFAITANATEYHFVTPFKAVPGFGANEESVARSNIVFGTRSCTFTDEETGWGFTIHGGEVSVNIVFDEVGSDDDARNEVNGRGMQYEYIGTHFLIIEQMVNGQRVTSQERKENLLFPKN